MALVIAGGTLHRKMKVSFEISNLPNLFGTELRRLPSGRIHLHRVPQSVEHSHIFTLPLVIAGGILHLKSAQNEVEF